MKRRDIIKKLSATVGIVFIILILGACTNSTASSQQHSSSESDYSSDLNSTDSENESEFSSSEKEGEARVVAGTLVLAEILEALDVPLVGVTSHNTEELPEAYRELPQVGSGPRINYEIIASLEPDYYLTTAAFEPMTREKIEGVGVEPVYFDYSRYEDIPKTIQEIGKIVGKSEKADGIVKGMENQEEQVLVGDNELEGSDIFILFGSSQNLSAASNDLYIGSLVEKLGMNNVADEFIPDGTTHAEFSTEAIIAQDPDYVIVYTLTNDFNMTEDDETETTEKRIAEEFNHEIWQETTAFQNNQVIHITTDDIPIQAGMKNVEYLANLKEMLLSGGPSHDQN